MPASGDQFAWMAVGDVGIGPVVLSGARYDELRPLLHSLLSLIRSTTDDLAALQVRLSFREKQHSRDVSLQVRRGQQDEEESLDLNEREADDLATALEALAERLRSMTGQHQQMLPRS